MVVAKDLVIGGLHLRNVPFQVLPDTDEPFSEFPANEYGRGLLGLPILLAMQTVRWRPGGDVDFGFPSGSDGQMHNLLFHDADPIVRVMVGHKPLEFSLDTGAINTDLNPVFAKDLPRLVSSGKKEKRTITGFGGTSSFDSVVLSSLVLEVGGKDVELAPAHVFVSGGLGGGSLFAGNLGNDLLNQAHTITLDFRVMSLRLN